ncbi:MAG: HD domain-containing protein [Halobacteriota archaeon]|nr:HD domain-containing protein [Halobacteriota archaeon]
MENELCYGAFYRKETDESLNVNDGVITVKKKHKLTPIRFNVFPICPECEEIKVEIKKGMKIQIKDQDSALSNVFVMRHDSKIELAPLVPMNEDLSAAVMMSETYHSGQFRKYTHEPYITHPYEVALIASAVSHYHPVESPFCAILGMLHDLVEDTNVTLSMIEEKFGVLMAINVAVLTDPTVGNRERRKARVREKFEGAAPVAKLVKLADIASNTPSIIKHDPKFAKVYLKEIDLLLPSLRCQYTEQLYKLVVKMIRREHAKK